MKGLVLLRNYLVRGGALLAAAAASLAMAPAAFAATISVDHPCYVTTGLGEGADVTVAGSGFNPGELIFAQIPAPDGLLGYAEATVAPDGSFTATVSNVFPETIAPVVETQTMQVTGVLSGAILAEAPFKLAPFSVMTNPPTASPHKKVAYDFSGFGSGKPIFGHYLRNGHVVLTYKFGKASGACGVLKAKARIYPGREGGKGKYEVQFDDHHQYSPNTARRFVTSVSTY